MAFEHADVVSNVAALIEIAGRAIEADEQDGLSKIAQSDLETAYTDFKAEIGVRRVERGTPEWDKMLEATKAEYLAAKDESRKATNAKSRLQSAIRRYRNRA